MAGRSQGRETEAGAAVACGLLPCADAGGVASIAGEEWAGQVSAECGVRSGSAEPRRCTAEPARWAHSCSQVEAGLEGEVSGPKV